jgi:hypothetical protein
VGLSSSKKTALERRLKELQKESELVRSDIKVLNKVVKNPDGFAQIPKLRSERQAPPIAPPLREDPVAKARAAAQELPPAGPHDDLFGLPPKVEPVRGWGRPPVSPEPNVGAKGKAAPKDERFANYFSSGGFLGGPRPMKQERNVQRNKAVFMVIVVIVVFFWVSYLVFK